MPAETDRPLGRANPLVARIRRLARSAADRERSGLILVEGIKLAGEALDAGIEVREAIVSSSLLGEERGRALRSRLCASKIPIRVAADSLMRSLQDADAPQGILLLAARPATDGHFISSAALGATLLACAGVQDPGNLGSLVRVAYAAGASGLVAAGGADPFGPKAVRASAGSIFRLPVSRVADAAALAPLLGSLRASGRIIAGAVPHEGRDYRDVDLAHGMALVVGGEGAGIPAPLLASMDLLLTIPLSGKVESINVATAAAVILFEAARQRQSSRR
jgi:RNA methyltransferase, TrmH family